MHMSMWAVSQWLAEILPVPVTEVCIKGVSPLLRCRCHQRLPRAQVEPGQENLLLSSASDKSISVWDIRKLGPGCRAVAQTAHPQTCNSAYFSPDGQSDTTHVLPHQRSLTLHSVAAVAGPCLVVRTVGHQ